MQEEQQIVEQETNSITVTLTLDGNAIDFDAENLDVNMDTSDRDILEKVNSVVESEFQGQSIVDTHGEYSYTVQKAQNQNRIFIFPKVQAG